MKQTISLGRCVGKQVKTPAERQLLIADTHGRLQYIFGDGYKIIFVSARQRYMMLRYYHIDLTAAFEC